MSREQSFSNVAMVYSSDPRLDPGARPLTRVTWSELARMHGGEWQPGSRLPFDPVAVRAAARHGMTVIFTGGDTGNLRSILEGRPYQGTTITGGEPRSREAGSREAGGPVRA